ncbi:hypothetical protein B0H19DRAFT_1075578 [Mycena capillaripes]|nr:hypothetical protein B0H19DRAFT_1075578 [Mycena capillaripes]
MGSYSILRRRTSGLASGNEGQNGGFYRIGGSRFCDSNNVLYTTEEKRINTTQSRSLITPTHHLLTTRWYNSSTIIKERYSLLNKRVPWDTKARVKERRKNRILGWSRVTEVVRCRVGDVRRGRGDPWYDHPFNYEASGGRKGWRGCRSWERVFVAAPDDERNNVWRVKHVVQMRPDASPWFRPMAMRATCPTDTYETRGVHVHDVYLHVASSMFPSRSRGSARADVSPATCGCDNSSKRRPRPGNRCSV